MFFWVTVYDTDIPCSKINFEIDWKCLTRLNLYKSGRIIDFLTH